MPTQGNYAQERQDMVESQLRRRGIHDERVLDAMLRIPRHEFVPAESRSVAYGDHPIPIGENQTISQPFIIAVAFQALGFIGSESDIEFDTCSGYPTSILALCAPS